MEVHWVEKYGTARRYGLGHSMAFGSSKYLANLAWNNKHSNINKT